MAEERSEDASHGRGGEFKATQNSFQEKRGRLNQSGLPRHHHVINSRANTVANARSTFEVCKGPNVALQ
jgi:hypothetical protein